MDVDVDDVSTITGDIEKDNLRMYLQGLYHDCTIRIGAKDGPQLFKCHKFVLASSSDVFGKMLMGHFKEASKGPDDPIDLKSNISPAAFDLALRYMYGRQADFKSTTLAIEVYHFADEWQIDHLAKAAGTFLEKTATLDEILPVFALFNSLGQEAGISRSLEIIKSKTVKVLDSEFWLSASEETVLSILKQEKLNISESDLLEAVVKWGTANVEEGVDVRDAIDSAVKLIRFRCMDYVEFGRISCDIGDILTDSEKYKILLSICLQDEKLMPPNFTRKNVPRNLPAGIRFYWNCSGIPSTEVTFDEDSHPSSKFTFSLTKTGYYLEGLSLDCLNNENQGKHLKLTCSLLKADLLLATVTFDCENKMGKTDTLYFPHPTLLTKDVLYTITVEYFEGFPIRSAKISVPGKVITYKNDGVDFHIHDSSEITDVCALFLTTVNKS